MLRLFAVIPVVFAVSLAGADGLMIPAEPDYPHDFLRNRMTHVIVAMGPLLTKRVPVGASLVAAQTSEYIGGNYCENRNCNRRTRISRKQFDAVFESMEDIQFVREDLDDFVKDTNQKDYDTVVFYNFHRPYPTDAQARAILGITERGQGNGYLTSRHSRLSRVGCLF